MKGRMSRLIFGLVALASLAPAVQISDWRQARVMMDSLSRVHPRFRASWLKEHGIDDPYYTTFQKPESTGLRCIGRWPWGPSWELAGRDSLLFIGSGSGVRILSISDSVHPRMLGQINARGLVSQVVVRDSLLFVACGSWGAQIHSISDPANPRELGSMDAVIGDVAVVDTLCYAVGSDSLRIYNVANPSLPTRLSALRDSGEVVAVANNHAFTGNQFVMNVIDVADPTQPCWVNSRSGDYLSLAARRNLLFQGSYDPEYFAILDVSNPLAITEASRLTGVSAKGLHVQGDYAYLAWGGFHAVDIADSAHPVLLGSSYHYDDEREPYVHAPGTYAYLACRYGGLKVIDIHQATAPQETTTCFVAGSAQDIGVRDTVTLVPCRLAGLNTVSLSDPTRPRDLGWLGATSGTDQLASSCTAKDSFGFVGWVPRPYFRSVSLSDPSLPSFAGQCSTAREAENMVLRDSFVYCAADYQFQVVNIARPRSPTVVGTCNVPDYSYGMRLRDTLAYVSTYPLTIINVSNPAQPRTIGSIPRGTWSVFVKDSFAYLAAVGLHVWNVRNPVSPQPVDSLTFGHMVYDVAVIDTLACLSCTDGLRLVSVANPHNMRVVAFRSLPYTGGRLVWAEPYVYVAVRDAGICVFEITQTGISEVERSLRMGAGLTVAPNPVRRWSNLVVQGRAGTLATVYDALGREVLRCRVNGQYIESSTKLDLGGLSPGLYFLRLDLPDRRATVKVVKQ